MANTGVDWHGGIINPGELTRYFLVSLLALGADVAVLLTLIHQAGLHYLVANAVAFVLGAVVAYLGSIAWVFRRRRFNARGPEFLIFVGIGVGGLWINELMLWTGIEYMDMPLGDAKASAAGTSFAFNYAVRKIILFI